MISKPISQHQGGAGGFSIRPDLAEGVDDILLVLEAKEHYGFILNLNVFLLGSPIKMKDWTAKSGLHWFIFWLGKLKD